MRSIKGRIERALLTAALIPVLLVSVFAYLTTQDALTQSGIQNTQTQARLLSSGIENTLKYVPGDLFYLRDANSMFEYGRALVINDENTKETLGRYIARDFLSIIKNRHIYNQIRLIGADGKELIRVEHNEQNGSSRVVPLELLHDKATSPHFQAAKSLTFGEYYVSPTDLNREEGKLAQPHQPTIRFATPIFAVGERLVAVLIMNVDANAFIDLIKQSNQHDATQFSLINKEGFYISHSDQSKEWGSVHDLSHGHSFSEDYPELADSITQVTSLSSTESEQSLITSLPVYADTEQQHILGYLIAETPKKVALKLLNTFTIGFVAFILFAAMIGFVFARLLSTSMTAPLRQLTLAADKLSKGEVDTPIEIKSRDEIQFLAEAFERLRESVKLLMRM